MEFGQKFLWLHMAISYKHLNSTLMGSCGRNSAVDKVFQTNALQQFIGAMYGASEKQTSIWHLEGYAQERCAGLQYDSEF